MIIIGASQVKNLALVVKNPPANAGDIRSLGQEDPLEEGMATLSCILAGRITWTEEPGGLHWVAKSQTRLKWLSRHMIIKIHFCVELKKWFSNMIMHKNTCGSLLDVQIARLSLLPQGSWIMGVVLVAGASWNCKFSKLPRQFWCMYT